MGDFKHEKPAMHTSDYAEAPPDGLKKVEYAIATAKAVKARHRAVRKKRRIQLVTASLAFLLVAVPNFSAEAAEAMSDIPIIGVFCEAVTFRDYHYSSERFQADVSVPEIIERTDDAIGSKQISAENADRINEKINAVADKLIEEFKQTAENSDEGYANLYVNYEVLHTADEYFTLKLITYQGAGSGYEQDYYYTIDINTGKEIGLADVFPEGSDYVEPISENIKQQMRDAMKNEESGAMYWVDIDEADPIYDWAFRSIKADQQFYVNADGNIVIAFDEGEVAPMYMGTQEFVIPEYVVKRIG